MPAYFVSNYRIHDQDQYQAYLNAVGPTLTTFNGKILVAGSGHTIVEGNPHPIVIVLEFESRDSLEAWFNSDAYQAVIHLRRDNSDGFVVFADSFPSS